MVFCGLPNRRHLKIGTPVDEFSNRQKFLQGFFFLIFILSAVSLLVELLLSTMPVVGVILPLKSCFWFSEAAQAIYARAVADHCSVESDGLSLNFGEIVWVSEI